MPDRPDDRGGPRGPGAIAAQNRDRARKARLKKRSGARRYTSEKFDGYEDTSVGLPDGSVLDAETNTVRKPIKFRASQQPRFKPRHLSPIVGIQLGLLQRARKGGPQGAAAQAILDGMRKADRERGGGFGLGDIAIDPLAGPRLALSAGRAGLSAVKGPLGVSAAPWVKTYQGAKTAGRATGTFAKVYTQGAGLTLDAIERDLELLDEYGKPGDVTPSLKGGVKHGLTADYRGSIRNGVIFGELADFMQKSVEERGVEAFTDPEIGRIATVMIAKGVLHNLVGPDAAKLLLLGDTSHKGMAALEILMVIPGLRAASVARAVTKAVAAKKPLAEVIAIGKETYKTSRPVIEAVKFGASKVPKPVRAVRDFDIGNGVKVAVNPAGSRVGRAVENFRDHLRGVDSEIRSGARQLGHERQIRERITGHPGNLLAKAARGMKDEQLYALLMLAEQRAPAGRIAAHAAWGREQPDAALKLYHEIHQDWIRKASSYIDEEGDGTLRLNGNAPDSLHHALDLLKEVSQTHEGIYRELGLITNEAMLSRAYKPARVFHGAQWRQLEEELNRRLEESGWRQQLFAKFDEAYPDDPELANAYKMYADMRARTDAHDSGNPLAADQWFVDYTHQVHPEQRIPQERFESQGSLFGDEQGDVLLQAEALPLGRELPSKIATKAIVNTITREALPLPRGMTSASLGEAIQRVYKLALGSAQHRNWYENAADNAHLYAEEFGIPVDKVAQILAILSQAADVKANGTLAIRALRHYSHTGELPESVGRFPGRQREEVEKVLKGEVWEGVDPKSPKRSSFFLNIFRRADPEGYAALDVEGNPVTVDRWVVRMFDDALGDVPGRFYPTFERALQLMGDRMGWSPDEVQAAAWVSIKRESLRKKYPHWPESRLDRESADAFSLSFQEHAAQGQLVYTPQERKGIIELARQRRAAKPAERPQDEQLFDPGAEQTKIEPGDMPIPPQWAEKIAARRKIDKYVFFLERQGAATPPQKRELEKQLDRLVKIDPQNPWAVEYAALADELETIPTDIPFSVAPDAGRSEALREMREAYERSVGGIEWNQAVEETLPKAEDLLKRRIGKERRKAEINTEIPEGGDRRSRVLTAAEARDQGPREGFVYHGTGDEVTAQRIQRDRRITTGDVRGENQGEQLAWVTKDPAYAAEHGEFVVEIPESAVPASARRVGGEGQVGPESFASSEDIVFQQERYGAPGYEEAASKIHDPEDGGFTLRADGSFDSEPWGFPAAYGAYEEQIPLEQFTQKHISDYADQYAAQLANPGHRLGGYVEDGIVHLDVAKIMDDKTEALAFAKEQGQLSIMDREAVFGRGDWDNGFPRTGLSVEEANAIKAELRQKQTLADRRGKDGQGAILGAAEFGPGGKVTTHTAAGATPSTLGHELAHKLRRELSPAEERQVAKWSGATAIRDANKKIVGYRWGRYAEERWANTVLQVLRGNRALRGKAGTKLEAALREDFNIVDLPDAPSNVVKVIARKFRQTKLPDEGRLFGSEDIQGSFEIEPFYVALERGSPASIKNPLRSSVSYLRYRGIFGGGKGAIGKGPQDRTLRKAFTGSLIRTGMFKPSVNASIKKLDAAVRISSASWVREKVVRAGTELPQSPGDRPVVVDPSKTGHAAGVQRLLDMIDSTTTGGSRISIDDVDGLDLSLARSAHESMFPATLEGKNADEVAQLILDGRMKPVDNVVWVPDSLLHAAGLINVPGSKQQVWRGYSKMLRVASEGGLMTFDIFNDIAKAGILYLNPAYIPVNLAGNLAMNIVQQGVYAPQNLYRAVRMHQSLDFGRRTLIDAIMGGGLTSTLALTRSPAKKVTNAMAHWANMAVDLIPRRAAFLHVAQKNGYQLEDGTLDAILRAAQRGDEDALTTLISMRDEAADAIVDFERMSPFEREFVTRIIFFYPWFRGATRYTYRFLLDHPMQAMGLALAMDYAHANAGEVMGDRPAYADMAFPIDTKSVGLSIPGTDLGVGLDDIVGQHGWYDAQGNPMTLNVRQLLTVTSPYDLLRAAYGMIPGAPGGSAQPEAVQNLTPFLSAAVAALSGTDSFGDEVPQDLSTFGKELVGGVPLLERTKKIRRTPEERAKANETAVYPREQGNETARLFGGAITPTPYSPEAGQKSAALDVGDQETADRIDLIRDSRKAGLGRPPKVVLEEAAWRSRLEKALEDISVTNDPEKAMKVAAKLFAEKIGDPDLPGRVANLKGEEARKVYLKIRELLYPSYAAWNRIINKAS